MQTPAVTRPVFRMLFQNAPGLCVALVPDAPRYTIVGVSDAYERATMMLREEMFGCGLLELLADEPTDTQSTARRLSESLGRVRSTRTIDAMPALKYTLRLPQDEGAGSEEHWWRVVNTPVLASDGTLAYVIHCVEPAANVEHLEPPGVQSEGTSGPPPGRISATPFETFLERHVAERTQELRRLAIDLESTETRERCQLARDLHDDLGQVLAAARIRLAVLCQDARADVRDAAHEVSNLVEEADRSTRALAAQLAPATLHELGLAPALEWLAEDLARRFGLQVDVRDDGMPKPLSQGARSIVYRAIWELLINVAKHAGVDHATVCSRLEDRSLVVRIADKGVGFETRHGKAKPAQGVGLISVRERLAYIGGGFEIRSIPGDGAEAELRVPLDDLQR